MTPAAKQRVNDEQVAADCEEGCWVDSHERDLALDLRDERAECARWRKCAEALAGALRGVEWAGEAGECPGCSFGEYHVDGCEVGSSLARFDAMSVTLHANVQEPDGTVHSVTRDVNAAILRLQKRLDAVRPVVAAVRRLATYGFGEVGAVAFAYAALPDDVREWAQDNQPRERQKESER